MHDCIEWPTWLFRLSKIDARRRGRSAWLKARGAHQPYAFAGFVQKINEGKRNVVLIAGQNLRGRTAGIFYRFSFGCREQGKISKSSQPPIADNTCSRLANNAEKTGNRVAFITNRIVRNVKESLFRKPKRSI